MVHRFAKGRDGWDESKPPPALELGSCDLAMVHWGQPMAGKWTVQVSGRVTERAAKSRESWHSPVRFRDSSHQWLG